MSQRAKYMPGPATGAEVKKDGENWTLVLTRELRHPAALVWQALTDPKELAQWAPFDADRDLSSTGPVKLSTFGAPQVSETTVKRAEAPKLLEYSWGGGDVRWELEPHGTGTRLTLWASINRGYIAWGAAGWHICIDVLDHLLAGEPVGRMAGPETMKFEGWQRLSAEYAEQFGVKLPELVKETRMETTLDKPALVGAHKTTKSVYWLVTGVFCLQIAFTAYAQLKLPQVAAAFTHLGFPDYFRVELSWAKFVGIALLLAPVPRRLKEWAYAGFAIDLASAVIAHLAVGDGPQAWGWAAATGVLWALSYVFWRRVSDG